MSRLSFRASVEDPRPASAWWMVSVATVTLSITGKLMPWALAIAGIALTISFIYRLDPRPWQRSPFVLNSVLFGIMTLSGLVLFRGSPTSVALAHFAVLTQGLQLLDARPRQSEFLLVTLSLFQVILAANLTDSVFFPLLVLLFLASTTWTLLVHTLRCEAIEAGERRLENPSQSQGLLRITALASIFSVLLGLVFFTVLPRFRSSMIQSAAGDGQAVAGFTDQVELGTIGKIRMDSAIVLRVETLEGDSPPIDAGYWRGLSLDHFDGTRWSVTPSMRSAPGGSPTFGIDLRRGETVSPLVQRIVREPVKGGVIFGAGEVRRIHGSIHRIETDVNGSLYAPNQTHERIRYTLVTEGHQPDDRSLRRDRIGVPARRGKAFLDLPELSPEITRLAERIVAEAETDADRVRALERHLRRNGSYTDSPPAMNSGPGRSPIEGFLLGQLSGHCEYFASGMVVMARSVGIPARLVNGFAGGRRNEIGNFIELTRSDAHAWVEVHFEAAGWVRYDPTPPDLRLRAITALGFRESMGQLASVIELWWYQRVVDFDSSDQIHAIRSGYLAWQGWRKPPALEDARDDRPAAASDRNIAGDLVLGVFALGAVFLGLALAWQRWRGRSRSPRLPSGYARALMLLRRKGLRRGPATTARDFLREVESRTTPAAAAAFRRITEEYLGERFGSHPPASAQRQLGILRQELRRSRPPAPVAAAR